MKKRETTGAKGSGRISCLVPKSTPLQYCEPWTPWIPKRRTGQVHFRNRFREDFVDGSAPQSNYKTVLAANMNDGVPAFLQKKEKLRKSSFKVVKNRRLEPGKIESVVLPQAEGGFEFITLATEKLLEITLRLSQSFAHLFVIQILSFFMNQIAH